MRVATMKQFLKNEVSFKSFTIIFLKPNACRRNTHRA